MKKILFGFLIVILLLFTVSYLYVPQFTYQQITSYEPFTFEKVLGDTAWVSEYEIGDHEGPKDYGYDTFEEVSFYSAIDSLKLSAWYIEAPKKTDSTIFLIHGRTSNRLKTMKYLELFRNQGLDTLYNIFIADMRNSGKSETASTFMGYSFAEDLAGGLNYLTTRQNQNNFVIYSFSMGAMATFVFLEREDLKSKDYKLDRIILDSPLTDVEYVLRNGAKKLSLPDFIFEEAFEMLDEDTNGYASKLKMSNLMEGRNIPMLIIQSNHDKTTPAENTKEQLAKLSNTNHIETWYVDSANHVKIYTHEDYRDQYERKVNKFIRGL